MKRTGLLGALAALALTSAALVGGAGVTEAHHGAAYAPNSIIHFVIGWNQNYDGFHEDDPGQTGHPDTDSTASGLSTETRGGNTTCSSGTALLKLDPVTNGTHTLSDGSKINISNYNGKTFDWAIHPDSLDDIDASVVLVKGGPATMAYFYQQDGTDQDSDTMLSAPLNGNNGRLYGISHVSFCFDPKGEVENPFD